MEEAAGALPRFVARVVPSPADVLLVAALLAPVAIHIPDYDVWWHLAAGRLILAQGHLPESDPFSFTREGVPWTAHEWLPEVLFQAVSARFGLDAILLLKALATGATLLLLWSTLATILPSPIARLGIGIAVLALMVPTFTPRPWMFSFLLLAALVRAFHLPTATPGAVVANALLLGGILALWINVHGMFVVGHLWLGAQLAGSLLPARRGTLDVAREVSRPLAAMALGAGGSLVHPLGPAMLLYPLEYQFTPTHETILEWFPPDMSSLYGRLLLVVYAVALVLLVRGGATAAGWITFFLFSYLAFTSRRNVALLGLAAAPAVAAAVGRIMAVREIPPASSRGRVQAFLWRRVDNFDTVARRKPASIWAALLALLLVIGFLGLNPRRGGADGLFKGPMFAKMFPVEATRWLLARDHPERSRLFNFYGWGGWVIYASDGRLKTFIDGRADLFGLEHIQEYHAVASLTPRWSEVLDAYRIDTILFPRDHALCQLLEASPRWKLLYEDPVARVFARVEDSQMAGSTS